MTTPQQTHLLRIRNIPSELIDIINSYLFYTMDEGNHRIRMKQIENSVNESIHFTVRDCHMSRIWGFRSQMGNQYQCAFCVKCGDYIWNDTDDATESIICVCVYGHIDVDEIYKQELIEEERWVEEPTVSRGTYGK